MDNTQRYNKISDEVLLSESQDIGIEESNFLYTNITPLIKLINRKSDQIQNSELAYFMEKGLDPERAIALVEQIQKEELMRIRNDPQKDILLQSNTTPTFYIFKTVLMSKFLLIGLLSFLDKAIQIGSVFFLDAVTDSIKDYNNKNLDSCSTPIFYLLAMTIIYLFGTYLDSKWENAGNQFRMLIKIIGQYLIYQKALRTKYLQETIQKKRGEQKKDGDEEHVANVNNLLTVDVDELNGIMWGIFEFFNSLLMIGAVIYMLYMKLGSAMYSGLIFFVIAIILNAIVSSLTIYFYRRALVHKDDRIGLTTDVIEGMKQIKYLSWEETFNNKILEFRRREFRMISCQKSVDTLNNVYWSSVSYLLLYFFLTSYISKNQTIDNPNPIENTNVFTIIALFNLLTFPMGVLPYCINQLINTRVSYGRIKTFLDVEEIDVNEVQDINERDDLVIDIPKLQYRWPVKKQQQLDTKKVLNTQVSDTDNDNEVYTFQLNIESLQIKKGSINMIIGRIGSGKTALLNAILNEMDKISQIPIDEQGELLKTFMEGEQVVKKIGIKGNLAYVSQNHWLQNMSIRDNITFGKPFDQALYLKCISSCELIHDLNTFPKKDLFILGPDAKNISGGQKQRISLCRAMYQDCDIYLMDDIFSSLDMHVADHVFQKVIKEYLLDRGKTVLMVTSQFRFIEMATKPNIIYINEGTICDDINLLNQFMSQEKEKEKEKLAEEKEDLEDKGQTEEEVQQFQLLESSDTKNNEPDDEERESGEIAFDTVKYYMSQMSWPIIISFFIFTITVILGRNLVDFWLRSQITPDDHTFDFLNHWFGDEFESIFASLIAINFAITCLSAGTMTICTLLSGWRIFKRLNSSIMNSTMKFFDTNPQGRIINRLSNDTLCVDDELPWYAGIFVNSLLACIGYPVGITILFPWMLVVIAFELVAFYKIQGIFRKSNRDLKRIQSTNEGKVISHLTETTSGLRIVRAFHKQTYFIEEYIRKLKESVCSLINSNKVSFWLGVRLHILSNVIFLSVSLTIIVFMLGGIQIDYSTCAMTLTYAVLIANSFNDTMRWFTQAEAKMVSVERIRQYFNNKQELLNKPVEINVEVKRKIHELIPYKPQRIILSEMKDYSIIFNDVTITYDDVMTVPNPKFALRNFTLFIKRGEKVAFVGRTGSGKTSILNILFRLYDFQQGQIYIDGKNIQTMPLADVRQMLSIVPQFGFLYNATLRENIDPQHQLEDKQIEDAFNKTGFRIRGIMEDESKDQSNTNVQFMIAKSGSNLSNGERQVINFMRIILQNKNIVCLDEATSNMDPKTDQELHKTLFDYVENRTLLVITHRLENIKYYDRIVVLENGEIVEVGSYDQLMAKEDGHFFKLQQQGFK